MEQKEKNQPAIFCGTFETRLENGHFVLPEPFLHKLENESPEEKLIFFFPHDVLFIFSEKGLLAMMNEAMRCSDQAVARKICYLASRSMETWSPDGTVRLPARLMEMYEFSPCEEISLIGMMNRIELWRSDCWKKQEEAFQEEWEPFQEEMLDELLRDFNI